MDQQIEVIRGLSTGEYFALQGPDFDIPSIKISPVPDQPIPLLIGGHGEAALRRAARSGDGWLHGGGDLSELPSLLARLAELRAECGRAEEPFEIHVISPDAYTADGVAALEEIGVTDVIVGFRWPYTVGPDTEPLDSKIKNLNSYASDVIGKVR